MAESGSVTVSSAIRLLIIGPSWVGDMVMAQSLFITLKQQNPLYQLDVLAPSWSLALLERMPEVQQGIAMPLGHGQFDFSHRLHLGQKLRSAAYQQCIVLPNSWKSALIPFFAKIPRRTGFLGEARWGLLNDIRHLNKSRLSMTVQRFVALGLDKSIFETPDYPSPRLSVSSSQQAEVIKKFAIDHTQNIVAFCPGAEYGPAKRWPAEHFAQLAILLHRQNRQIWLIGSEKDRQTCDIINQQSGNICSNFAGLSSLGEAVDLLSLADVVVSNDSGLMHVAAALDKKLIAIYGSSDPGFTPPLNPNAKIIRKTLDCAPCFKRLCPLGHTHCLTEIQPESLFSAINTLD